MANRCMALNSTNKKLSLFRCNGRFNGKFAFASGKNVFLRQKQFKSIEDDEFTLEFARCVVRGKLRNQLTFMQRTLRTKSVNEVAQKAVNGLKQALSFDLVEELRVPLADTLTVSMFNLGVLSEGNFEDVSFSRDGDYPRQPENAESDYENPEKRGVLLTKEGLRKVITQFEKKLDTPFFYPPVDGRITYKKIFFEQIKHFRRVLTGEESRYNPFQIK